MPPSSETDDLLSLPALPAGQPARFRATVHGTVFGERSASLDQVRTGDPLTLLPDPPVEEAPRVWVHLPTGEPLGHLPTEIGDWLAPWLLAGGGADATVLRISGPEVPSWRRLLIEVSCRGERDRIRTAAPKPTGAKGSEPPEPPASPGSHASQ